MTLPLTLLECSHRITPAAAATWRSEDHVAGRRAASAPSPPPPGIEDVAHVAVVRRALRHALHARRRSRLIERQGAVALRLASCRHGLARSAGWVELNATSGRDGAFLAAGRRQKMRKAARETRAAFARLIINCLSWTT